jgi:hypothetical protein
MNREQWIHVVVVGVFVVLGALWVLYELTSPGDPRYFGP